MKKYFLNLILCSFALLLSVGGASAQITTLAPNSDSTAVLCSDDLGVHDIGVLVYNASLTSRDGIWDLVSNDIKSSDLAAYQSGSSSFFVENLRSEKYNFAGLAPGLYSFVYTSVTSACLEANAKVIARVLVTQNAKNESAKIYVCPDETYLLKLRSLLEPALQDSAILLLTDEHTSGLLTNDGFALSGTDPDETVNIDGTKVYKGENTMTTFSFKYYNRVSPCQDTATVVVTVDQNKANVEFASDSLALCLEEMDSVYQISNYTHVQVAGGTWAFTSSTASPASTVTILDAATGEIKFSKPYGKGDYLFTYAYEDCADPANGLTKEFTITITEDLANNGFVNENDSVCKSAEPNRIYDLMYDGFGAGIVPGSGTWSQIAGPATVNIDADGKVHVYEFEVGSYEFKYHVSNALESNYCGILDLERILKLQVGDLSGGQLSAADYQLCLDATYDPGDSISLPGLVTGIHLVDVVDWDKPASINVSSTGSVSKADLAALGKGDWMFTLKYTSPGCSADEQGELLLYVKNTWEIDQSDSLRLFCRPDIDSLLGFNMMEMTGIEGTYKLIEVKPADGTVTLTEARNADGTPVNEGGDFTGSYIREAASVYQDINGFTTVEYVIEFTPTSNACGAEVVTLRLIFTGEEYGTVVYP